MIVDASAAVLALGPIIKQRVSVYVKQQMSTVIAQFSQQMKKKHQGITSVSNQLQKYFDVTCNSEDGSISINTNLSQSIKNIVDQQSYNILQDNINIIINNRAQQIVQQIASANIDLLLTDEMMQNIFDESIGG